jgi:hypothetical protein
MALSGGSYVPSVNFFGALGEIGDTIALGRQEEKDKALLGGANYKPPASFIDQLVGAVAPQKPTAIEGAVTPNVSRGASTNGRALYDALVSKGAHPNEAALLAGEAGVESGYNPTTVHDQGTGYGLWGHRLERLDAMRRFTGTDHPTAEQQAEFALHELRTRPEHAKVLAARTPQELADAGMFYERPKGFTPENPRGGLNYEERLAAISRFAPGTAGTAPVQVADASGRVPIGGGEPPTVAQPFDSTARLKALFPTHPGLQTPEGITAAMNAGSPHVRAIAKQAWEVYTKDLARGQAVEQKAIERSDERAYREQTREDERRYREQMRIDERGYKEQVRQDILKEKAEAKAAEGPKPPTEQQSRANTLVQSAQYYDKLLNDPRILGAGLGPRAAANQLSSGIPVVGSFITSEKYKQFKSAGEAFAQNILYLRSGQSAPAAEVEKTAREFTPQPGDGPERIAQIKEAREIALKGALEQAQRRVGAVGTTASPQGGGPSVGAVEDGYRFKGGNPADPNSWERAQ